MLPEQPGDDGEWLSADDVGRYEQGSPISRWALARYLVGRAIGESVGSTLLTVAVVLLALAAVGQWVIHSTLLAVLLAIVAVGVLLIRGVLRAVLRRLTEADRYGPVETRLRALVSDTRGDVLRELRRVGLPSHTITLPILAFRLIGRRRKETVVRLREFDITQAVPKARLDELHMLLGGR
ncbi:MAG: hypothetical protein QOI15_610 [Pseudonocardiales bacterium]|nr:hypothetical protein [Pseudonocardiales bacterium]MDT4919708.1 hypothetical protein [Pseudonocardiales bacterium]MDT4941612.1 hypothetical protein [Pseudonocardiales bacterium]